MCNFVPMKPNLRAYCEAGRLEAGCDEAGRGPLAGPVYCAAVILPPDFFHPLLNDSKQMSQKAREELRPIIEREAVAWAVEAVSAQEIDQLNILWASVTGMQRAVLRLEPDCMRELAREYPEYGWDRNMGYPTAEHIEAIRRHGYSPWHRKSFHVKELEPSLF